MVSPRCSGGGVAEEEPLCFMKLSCLLSLIIPPREKQILCFSETIKLHVFSFTQTMKTSRPLCLLLLCDAASTVDL